MSITIPQQLIMAGARFILVGKNSKAAIEPEWELNNYDATSPRLLNHISDGGNYGVITRNGLCVLDIDNPDEFRKRNPNLPKSFMVTRDNGASGHYYFKCPDCPEEMKKKIETSWGDIRLGGNFYTVAPGSVAPSRDDNTRLLTYDVVCGDPVAEVSWEKIKSLVEERALQQSNQKGPYECPEKIQKGKRHTELVRVAGKLILSNLPASSIREALVALNEERFDPPFSSAELGNEIENAYKFVEQKERQKEQNRIKDNEQKRKDQITKYGISLDDCGNAIRFCNQYGKITKHCERWGKWFIWDGQRWKEDDNNMIYYLAKKVSKSIYNEAAACSDQKDSLELSKWAHESSNNSRINAMVESTKSEHDYGIPIRFDSLDTDPYLFNMVNGTFDLRTIEKFPHDQITMITKLSPVEYDKNAVCPQWLAFLNRIFRNQKEKEQLISFLQRACGYSLTGDTKEQVMFFLYGSGANGKSTFIDVIQYIMGDYGAATESTTFTTQKGDAIRNDIARLVGMRFVSASENSTESLLDEALVKKLTGGEKISARFLHQEFFEFYPSFKIWWGFNHQPYIRDNTNSIWRRILLVPFEEKIPEKEQDKKLALKLHNEASGIFNWMVDGLIEYNRIGLQPPEVVKAATQEYREDQDILHDFIKECCITIDDIKKENGDISKDLSIPASSLYNNYSSWYKFNGGAQKDLISITKFGRLLIELGFSRDRKKTGKYYHGITLKDYTK